MVCRGQVLLFRYSKAVFIEAAPMRLPEIKDIASNTELGNKYYAGAEADYQERYLIAEHILTSAFNSVIQDMTEKKNIPLSFID